MLIMAATNLHSLCGVYFVSFLVLGLGITHFTCCAIYGIEVSTADVLHCIVFCFGYMYVASDFSCFVK